MHELQRIGEDAAVPKRISIPRAGLVFVGARRPYHDGEQAHVVVLADPTVSSGRHGHCQIRWRDDRLEVYDAGSDNGTWVRNEGGMQRVGGPDAPTSLVGVELSIGRCMFRLVEGEALPKVRVQITLLRTDEGGRTQALPNARFCCSVIFDGVAALADHAYDCRLLVDERDTAIAPGETVDEIEIVFLSPETVLPHLCPGVRFTLWEGRPIGSGSVVSVE